MASQKWGSYAFLLGVIIAVVVGIVASIVPDMMTVGSMELITLVLVILGLIVGFLNIHDKNVTSFLIATIAVSMVGGVTSVTAGGFVAVSEISIIGFLIANIVGSIVALVAPAALVVGLKQIWVLAKEQVN